jgi:hypothetical protein
MAEDPRGLTEEVAQGLCSTRPRISQGDRTEDAPSVLGGADDRTRGDHSLRMEQIARGISRRLKASRPAHQGWHVGPAGALGPLGGALLRRLFSRPQRNEKALGLALVKMYVEGISTEKVKVVTEPCKLLPSAGASDLFACWLPRHDLKAWQMAPARGRGLSLPV